MSGGPAQKRRGAVKGVSRRSVSTCLLCHVAAMLVLNCCPRGLSSWGRSSGAALAFDGGGGGAAKGFGASSRAASSSSSRKKKAASALGGRRPPSKLAKARKSSSFASRTLLRPAEDRRVAGAVGPRRKVPSSIARPDYALTGTPASSLVDSLRPPWMIETKTAADVDKMRVAGRLAREVLDLTGRAVAPGMTTDALDAIAHAAILERGAYPSPLNYHGYPKSICTSVNEIICHGIPDDVPLAEGDIVNLDVTVYYDGFHGDCSEMFFVGDDVDEESQRLVAVTYDAWRAAIDSCAVGKPFAEIGAVIEDFVTPFGYASVKQFCGHGIGRTFHTAPNVLHYRNAEPNGVMAEGQVFTIEPMICEGTQDADMWDDNWTAATKDLGRSAQFEHTLLMTADGAVPLTAKLDDSPVQPWEKQYEHRQQRRDAAQRHNNVAAPR
eukprot:CAMPEP_0185688750 /NCGR_PEP_ID=MMETSP1164-20130828/28_1 /TAXON_ID=1104430 /ORGANISM="Chrysoreinhardia sp, Strain CCMP2950" /LENGTH=438 /DNA_ID=CAMNT_0028355209 /DNA_START=45 /DNA_END=1361 /DNA_ORIENTATION=-